MKNTIRKFLDDVASVLAGFQLAGGVISFFGIGAIAKWILEHWLPFTRWAWGEIFAYIRLPDISAAEKDSLTTLAFFVPMAISSAISWWTRERTLLDTSRSQADVAKELRARIYAAIAGTIFMVIVGGGVIQDTISLFMPVVTNSEKEGLLDTEAFAWIGLFAMVVTLIASISAMIYWIKRRISTWRRHFISAAMSVAASGMSAIMSLVSFGAMFSGIVIAAGELGPIRTVAPILVLLSLLATIYLNPARLLKTAGVVIALVVASLGWDLALWAVEAVETAPTDNG